MLTSRSRSYPRHLVKFCEKKRNLFTFLFSHLFKKDATFFVGIFFLYLKRCNFFSLVSLSYLYAEISTNSFGFFWMEIETARYTYTYIASGLKTIVVDE